MTRVDAGASARGAPHADVQHEAGAGERGRQFARCLSTAERRAACEAQQSGDAAGAGVDPTAGVAVVPQGGATTASPAENFSDMPVDPQVAASVPGRPVEPGSTGARTRERERTAADDPSTASFDAARAQQGVAHLEAPPPARAPNSDASVLARSMLAQLPWTGGADRTLTVSFPAGGGAVEQIVLTVSGGVVDVVVTTRSQQRERVAAALPELARLMRQRGIRVGAVGLG